MRWVSTEESVAEGEITALAILETVLAVALYWGVALYFDTHWHLLTSICVAPLLLLRSPESTEEGVERFHAYVKGETKLSPRGTPVRYWSVVLLSVLGAAVIAYALAHDMLLDHSGWPLFLRSFLVGAVAGVGAVVVAVAVAVAVAGAGAGAGAGVVAVAGAGVVAVAGAGVVAVAVAGAGVGVVAVAVAVAGAGVGVVAVAGVVAFFGIPFIFGIWIRALHTRIVTTLSHLGPGWRSLPNNLRYVVAVIDSRHPPELVPGLESQGSAWTFQGMTKEFRSGNAFERVLYFRVMMIFFPPALFYRWSLKSTFWFYLPLVYLASGKKLEDEGRVLVDLLHDSRRESLYRYLAIGVFISTGFTTFALPKIVLLRDSFSSFPVWLYLLAFDLKKLDSWQWLGLASVIITAGIFFYGEAVYRTWRLKKENDPSANPDPHHVLWLLWLARWRNLFTTWASLGIAFGFVVLALYPINLDHLPPALSFIKDIYGPYLR